MSIRVTIPLHLRRLANVDGSEVTVEVTGEVTQRSVLDALEEKYPQLRGTVRDYATQRRRTLVRFYACGEDLSNDDPDTPLPPEVASGKERYMIVGSIAGG